MRRLLRAMCVVLPALIAAPLGAIVTASSSYDADITYGDVVDGINFGGVVEITSVIDGTTYGCSGSLLTDGYSILTAGHCVLNSSGSAAPSSVTVYFMGPSGMVSESVSRVDVDPSYSVGNSQEGSDLAVLTLSQQAPPFAVEYSLFSGDTPIDTPVVMAGYGLSGTGLTGADGSFGTLQAGENEYMGTGKEFFCDPHQPSCDYSSQLLVGEFYESGVPSTNALGCDPSYYYVCSTATPYTGFDEVDISPGDSGGPTFYDGEIVGVHDLGICVIAVANGPCIEPPSINSANNSYFGEMFADTSVADNLAFIEGAEVPEPGTGALLIGILCLFAGMGARARVSRTTTSWLNRMSR